MSKTWDSSELEIFIGAVPVDAGRDTGAFLRLTSPGGPLYTQSRGADGELVNNRTGVNDLKADLILMKSSITNAFLSTQVSADKIAVGGIVVPFVAKHVGHGTIVVARSAKIIEDPTVAGVDYGQEIGTYTWGLSLYGIRKFFSGMAETPLAPL